MPAVYPFRAVQYTLGRADISGLVAPPYDVLNATSKAALIEANEFNIVSIDLPHTPAKELGPPEAYEGAGDKYRLWLGSGRLSQRAEGAMFAYRQTFTGADGKTYQRSGICCTVEAVPFGPRNGGGILPHEETFSGPKEDRLALMKATRAQLSPIFGLHADEDGAATRLIREVCSRGEPDLTARTADGTLHEVWTVTDEATVRAYQDALAGEDVFIADGHHRYTTGLNYIKHLESQGPVPAEHPSRRSMMVLVGMSDPGLVIWPTHRVLGGMKDYSFERFARGTEGLLKIRPAQHAAQNIEAEMAEVGGGKTVFGLIDFQDDKCYIATLEAEDPLKGRFPNKPQAWRTLDVALIQHAIVEEVCQPKLNGGQAVMWGFPHTVDETLEIARGAETGAGGGKGFVPQLAIIVRPTPLEAVKAVSAANELMPQKSTFFYPKLATGLFINPLG